MISNEWLTLISMSALLWHPLPPITCLKPDARDSNPVLYQAESWEIKFFFSPNKHRPRHFVSPFANDQHWGHVFRFPFAEESIIIDTWCTPSKSSCVSNLLCGERTPRPITQNSHHDLLGRCEFALCVHSQSFVLLPNHPAHPISCVANAHHVPSHRIRTMICRVVLCAFTLSRLSWITNVSRCRTPVVKSGLSVLHVLSFVSPSNSMSFKST